MGLIKPVMLLMLLAQSAAADGYWQDAWMTRDQQGAWYFAKADYPEAARRFQDPYWQATAWYAAENFSTAAYLFSQLETADGSFNAGNALAHLKNYHAAAKQYQAALIMRPGWVAALENLSLVEVLSTEAEQPEDYTGGSSGKIGADEIIFEKNTNRMQQAEETEEIYDAALMTSQSVNELWMRRLQTTPADFLRIKFLYQATVENADASSTQP